MAIAQSEVLIQGRSYDWADIKVSLLGRVVEGIKAISWKHSQAKQNNYGAGNQPISRGKGNKEATGSITLTYQEIIAIQNALPPGKVMEDITMFPIVASFTSETNQFVSYVLSHCEFMECGLDMSQGDMDASYAIPLVIGTVRKVA